MTSLKKLYHGACYYPELWPESDIDRDIAEMKRVGLNVVRLGEFAWSAIEPDEGAVSFDFFARVLDRLHAAGLDVVFCTPTPTPPIWLTHGHPERCFVDAEGRTMMHGARQHASYEHPEVRAACLRVVEALAAALGRHPAIIAWQIDNEFKCHVGEDFSAAAVAHWHRWLERRFGTIDALNAAWGTEIWSERYQRFEQVPAPGRTPFLHNASLSTAYRMFSRESIADFMDAQSAAIRRHSSAPITHNFGLGFSVNFERMCERLDFASFDDYPDRDHWSICWLLVQTIGSLMAYREASWLPIGPLRPPRPDKWPGSMRPIAGSSMRCGPTAGCRCGRWPSSCTSRAPARTPGWSACTTPASSPATRPRSTRAGTATASRPTST